MQQGCMVALNEEGSETSHELVAAHRSMRSVMQNALHVCSQGEFHQVHTPHTGYLGLVEPQALGRALDNPQAYKHRGRPERDHRWEDSPSHEDLHAAGPG